MGKPAELLPEAESNAVASDVMKESKAVIEPTRWEIEPDEIDRTHVLLPEVAGTLVIGDVHNRIARADAWIEDQRFERVVLVGDYFDHVDETTEDAERTAQWVKKRVHNPRIVMLLGNHDVQYRWPRNDSLICPGYSSQKADVIQSILEPCDWERMRLACFLEGFLISHAGFHPTWISEPSVEAILNRCAQADKRAARGELDPIFGFGEIPGGVQRYGGPLWMDWRALLPIAGINQIVGHSPGDEVRFCATPDSKNVCLDVRQVSVAALICKGQVHIIRAADPALPG